MLKKVELSEDLRVHLRGILEDIATAETAIFAASGQKKRLGEQLWAAIHDEHPEVEGRAARLHHTTLAITFVMPPGTEYKCAQCGRRKSSYGDAPHCDDCSKWGDESVRMSRVVEPENEKPKKKRKKNAGEDLC